jgi:hypothetical protein
MIETVENRHEESAKTISYSESCAETQVIILKQCEGHHSRLCIEVPSASIQLSTSNIKY